ncbi:jg17776 [Pararge aegeria aegeria]|uniref:Jg17776 protein n=1 Tax=Pararge aegeria aegeria TaxID=348720 RepID=A0A8S4R8C9_9NEOP|nr:jg17776 [Pararge aegeria aegeria]
MDVGVRRCWNGHLAPVTVASLDSPRGGWMPSNESEGAAGPKQHRTVVFGTPYKRPMSSSGQRKIEVQEMLGSCLTRCQPLTIKLRWRC